MTCSLVHLVADLMVKSNGAAIKLASEEMNELKFDFKLPSSNGSALWKVSGTDEANELIDEDELLTEEDLKRPVLPGLFFGLSSIQNELQYGMLFYCGLTHIGWLCSQ